MDSAQREGSADMNNSMAADTHLARQDSYAEDLVDVESRLSDQQSITKDVEAADPTPVSYTHLTLPTKRIV